MYILGEWLWPEKRKIFENSIAATATAKSLQSSPTLCDPIDGSPLGSSVSEILQARILEWGAIAVSNAWKWKVKVTSVSCNCGRVAEVTGEGNGTPLQYSCLENPMDGGAWWAVVHGVTKSQTRLKRLSSSSIGLYKGSVYTPSLSNCMLINIKDCRCNAEDYLFWFC